MERSQKELQKQRIESRGERKGGITGEKNEIKVDKKLK